MVEGLQLLNIISIYFKLYVSRPYTNISHPARSLVSTVVFSRGQLVDTHYASHTDVSRVLECIFSNSQRTGSRTTLADNEWRDQFVVSRQLVLVIGARRHVCSLSRNLDRIVDFDRNCSMILKCGLILLSLHTLVPKTFGNDTENLKAFIDLTEFSYAEKCEHVANEKWKFIYNPQNETLLYAWEEAQKDYAALKKHEVEALQNNSHTELTDDFVEYQYNTQIKPGDALLDTSKLDQLISFSVKATFLEMGANQTSNTRQETEQLLSSNVDLERKQSAWTQWHRRLSPLLTDFSSTLSFVSEAATANGIDSVEGYWEFLSVYPGGYESIQSMWGSIAELHNKVVTFVKNRLAEKCKVKLHDDGIPAYCLGSLDGNDWTPLASDVLPYGNVTYSIKKKLWDKNLRGKLAYRSASAIGHTVLHEVPHASFWENSRFNQSCVTRFLNFCYKGTRVTTCHHASLTNFLTAHKVVAKVLTSQMGLVGIEKLPFLNSANRYSGFEEGISELFSILSVSPAQLQTLGLVSNDTDTDHSQITSLMITALDVLPRLAYYISADVWRINVIKNGTFEPKVLLETWWQYRKQYEGVTSDHTDIPTFLDDEFIASNKPYLSKFLGTLLGFQIYEYMNEGRSEVRNATRESASDNWTTMINKYLEITEVNADALLSYFQPLVEYLDNEPEDMYSMTTDQQSDIERLEKLYASSDVTTTARTTTTRMSKPKLLKPSSEKINSSSLSPPAATPIVPEKEKEGTVKRPNGKIIPESEKPANAPNGEDEYTSDINTSKAVWAVAAVLVATVAICVIAIFGRRRCVKSQTPKNRRYV
ncbi:angiotensin-converting enzyme 2 isoform X2 [Neodiprion pinetum]|uniref:angiotensin-converting enzyme 2 isoform X2 n=1 Tax=Neodiprion pinetum TaxID=441929 RepID=UPI001EDD1FFC|nr:angiotensin-converting enzyme-like isoform X2 [Neodiprion pinetum]